MGAVVFSPIPYIPRVPGSYFSVCAVPYHRNFKLNDGSGHGPSLGLCPRRHLLIIFLCLKHLISSVLLLLAAPYSQAAPFHYAHHTHTPEAFRGGWGGTPQRGLGQSPREGPWPDPSLTVKLKGSMIYIWYI